ncbi:MAG: hypothetical protein RLZZ69_2738 [Cyanobacteriota bacterium]
MTISISLADINNAYFVLLKSIVSNNFIRDKIDIIYHYVKMTNE